MPDFEDSEFPDSGLDQALSEVPVTRLSERDAPQSSREAAIQEVVEYYSPSADNTRSHEERREQAMAATLAQFAQSGPAMQQSVMRALKVQSLLDRGLIERLPLPAPQLPSDNSGVAQDAYVQAVCNDSRLAMRLMNKMAAEHPALAGESFGAHAERIARIDFDKGFSDCEYPSLHESAVVSSLAQVESAHGCDVDGVVDEMQVERENMHLIAQALRLRLASEEQALGMAQNGAGLPTDIDSVDLSALNLPPFMLGLRSDSAGEAGGESGEVGNPPEYPRHR